MEKYMTKVYKEVYFAINMVNNKNKKVAEKAFMKIS